MSGGPIATTTLGSALPSRKGWAFVTTLALKDYAVIE